jgi:hypothetical protein
MKLFKFIHLNNTDIQLFFYIKIDYINSCAKKYSDRKSILLKTIYLNISIHRLITINNNCFYK